MTRLHALVVTLVALTATSCGSLADPAAAVVSGTEIRASEVEAALADFEASPEFERLAEQQGADPLRRTFEQNFLQRRIRVLVLEPLAAERGISVGDSDVARRIDQIKADFESEEAFADALSQQGLDEEALFDLVYESELEERLRAEVVAGMEPSEAELEAAYEEDTARFTEYRASHILVEDNATAQRVLSRLGRAEEARVEPLFESLAQEFSTDPGSKDQGGDLGYAPAGQYVEPFGNALENLDVGEVSNPVRTEFGFHIIYLRDVRITPFEEVREQLTGELAGERQDAEWSAFVRDAYEVAAVEVNPRYGALDLATQTIGEAGPGDLPGAATPPPAPTPTGAPDPLG